MFVVEGARQQLLKAERQRFLEKEWPDVVATIQRLEFDSRTLLKAMDDTESSDGRDAE
jgi:hypothetical protein